MSPKKAPAKPAAPAARKSVSGKRNAPPPPPPLFNLSAERQLDVWGIILALGGFSDRFWRCFHSTRVAVTGTLLSALDFLFGYGAYILPFVLIGFGVWLVIRKIDRIPPVSIERVSGMLLLLLLIQTVIHGLTDDGGWFGNLLYYRMLETTSAGAEHVVTMLAWLLIALVMAFDLTVPELLAKLKPLFDALGKLWTMAFARLQKRTGGSNSPELAPTDDGYIPLNPATVPPAEPIVPPIGVRSAFRSQPA